MITLATIEGSKQPLSNWQAQCRNIEDKKQILLELEEGVGSVECNRLVVGLMRKALFAQAKAAHAKAPPSPDNDLDHEAKINRSRQLSELSLLMRGF